MSKEEKDDFDIAIERLENEERALDREIKALQDKKAGIFDSRRAIEATARDVRRTREVKAKQAAQRPDHSSLAAQISGVENGNVVQR